MVYFPYFESQWASHRSLLRSASHTDLILVCKGGHQVHLHRAMLVTRSPLLADLFSSQESPIISLPEVDENTVWRLVDLLYSGSCALPSPASADGLEELIKQLDLEGNVAELSVLEEVQQPQGNGEEASIENAMREVVRRALCRKASVKRKSSFSPSPAVAKKAKAEEGRCEAEVVEEEEKETPATMPRDTPRICPLCGFACTSAFHLKAHLATNHFLDQLSAMVAPGGFSENAETKVLHCDLCDINISGARTLYRAAVHRAIEHAALAPLLRRRLEELKQQRFCRICGIFAPLKASSEDLSLMQGSEVATALSREQSQLALALHLAIKHYMGRLLAGLKPGQLTCHFCHLVCRLPQVLAVHLGVCHTMALDIHNWDEGGGENEQVAKQVLEEKEVGEGGSDENMLGSLEGNCAEEVDEDSCRGDGLCANDKEEEDTLKNSVEDIAETRQELLGKNQDEEVSSGNCRENHEENEVSHAAIGIENALEHESKVSRNLNSKVSSSIVEECYSRDDEEVDKREGSLNSKVNTALTEHCCNQDNLDGLLCPKCDQICKDNANLKNHLLSHYYQDFYKVTPDAKPFPCPTCGKENRDRISLIRHFAFSHDMIYELTEVTPEMLKQALHGKNLEEEEISSGNANENHEENEVNYAEIGIDSEEAPEHESEVLGNLNSKVNSSTAEDCCSQDEVESANIKDTTTTVDKAKVGAVSETTNTSQAEDPQISPRPFFEKGGSVVWAEFPGGCSWFPAILPSALNTPSISYILPFPAKPASNLVQLFDSEGSWKRVEVVEPLGEDREADEAKLRAEGNLVKRRLAYSKALQYQSRQIEEKVTELDLNISHSGGENEKKEALEKQKDFKEFALPKPVEQKSEGGNRSKSALRGGTESESKRRSKRKRNSSIVTRSQSVQRQTSQAEAREEECKEPELPFYALLPRGLTLTRLRGGQ